MFVTDLTETVLVQRANYKEMTGTVLIIGSENTSETPILLSHIFSFCCLCFLASFRYNIRKVAHCPVLTLLMFYL